MVFLVNLFATCRDTYLFSTFAPPAIQNLLTSFISHTGAKTMRMSSFFPTGLVGSFHKLFLIMTQIIKTCFVKIIGWNRTILNYDAIIKTYFVSSRQAKDCDNYISRFVLKNIFAFRRSLV